MHAAELTLLFSCVAVMAAQEPLSVGNRLVTAAGVAPTGPNAISRPVLRRGGI